jgi:ribosomal protein S18 acetylase RimI-like enzyme
MMRTQVVTSRPQLELFLRRDPYLHLYELGDLDPFFWPRTRWLASLDEQSGESGAIRHLALLYDAPALPVLMVLAAEPDAAWRRWLESITPELPDRVYAHLSPGLEQALEGAFELEPHGRHLRMALTRPNLDLSETERVDRLTPADRPALDAFYTEAYPGSWFDPRMLETMHYYAWREDGAILSVAGIHVWSVEYGVAALGNIATHPAHRSRGLARRVTARLCRELLPTAAHIGLNVHAENAAAIACYADLGFETIAEYGEFLARRR